MTTLNQSTTKSTHRRGRWVRVPHELHKDAMKKRAARAYLRLDGSTAELAALFGLRSHSGVSRRRQGLEGPLAPLLAEIDAVVRSGRDALPYLEAVLETIAAARVGTGESLTDLSIAEQAIDAEEDMAQIEFHATGSARRWTDAVLRRMAFDASRLAPALERAG
jgi:hypothetical protein